SQNQKDDKGDMVEIVGADLLRQLQSDTARADNADDRRRARVRLEEIKHLTGDHRQDLRQQAVADLKPPVAASGYDRFALAELRRFDRFRKQLAEGAGIG